MSVEPPLPARADTRREPLAVAAAQPRCVAGDVATNVAAHVAAIRGARTRLLVFPELSLTGYLLSAAPLTPDDPVLRPLVTACAATHTAALIGAPVLDGAGRKSIAVLLVDGGGVEVCYRKTHLGGDEPAHFSAGDGPAVVEVDGWRIGVGVCRDTGIADHVTATAALGVDVYAAGLVHAPDELAEQDARGVRIAAACAAHVVFAGAAGPVGGPYDETAGSSTVWAPDGAVLARADAAPGRFAGTTIGTA